MSPGKNTWKAKKHAGVIQFALQKAHITKPFQKERAFLTHHIHVSKRSNETRIGHLGTAHPSPSTPSLNRMYARWGGLQGLTNSIVHIKPGRPALVRRPSVISAFDTLSPFSWGRHAKNRSLYALRPFNQTDLATHVGNMCSRKRHSC